MALLFMDGFDAGDFAIKWSSVLGCQNSTSTRFGTGRSLQAVTSSHSVSKTFPAAAQVYVGFAFSYNVTQGTVSSSPAISLYGDNNATQHLNISLGSGGVAVYRGTTLLASSALTEPILPTWHYVEVAATIADTGGTCVVRVNGTELINFTGDTKNGGTNNTTDTIRFIRSSQQTFWDDVYVCDNTGTMNNGFLGDVRVQTLSPSGAGSSTQFAPTGSANNWDNVDEAPYSTTDYNSSATTGQRDLYTLTDLAATTASVKAIQNNLIARKTDSGTRVLKTAVKSGGTVYTSTGVNLSATDLTVSTIRETDPATSAAWTVSGVNALEAGAEVG